MWLATRKVERKKVINRIQWDSKLIDLLFKLMSVNPTLLDNFHILYMELLQCNVFECNNSRNSRKVNKKISKMFKRPMEHFKATWSNLLL